jgi:hypothetical protein
MSHFFLMVHRPPAPSIGDETVSKPKFTLFNESRIGNVTSQEDIMFAGADNNEMWWLVDGHQKDLDIEGSKEMRMVGIAYGMPLKLEQFGLFHVSCGIAY